MSDQILLFQIQEDKEDYKEVMKEISRTCNSCRLSVLHPNNRGIVWRGSLTSKIAVVSEMPGEKEMEKGLPLVGRSGELWEKWAKYINIDTRTDCFITNVVQCQPDKEYDYKTEKWGQRAPKEDEIQACFGPRCLRVLKSMPNLEVVLTLGWVAAKAILGGEPKGKTHENKWFRTSILPGIAVYCMVHPSFLIREPSQEKSEGAKRGLDNFKREYLDTKKVLGMVKSAEAEERKDTVWQSQT